MTYIRKTYDEYEIQGKYGFTYGFEVLCYETSMKEARQRLREYRENEPGIPFRVVKKRIKKEGIK